MDGEQIITESSFLLLLLLGGVRVNCFFKGLH